VCAGRHAGPILSRMLETIARSWILRQKFLFFIARPKPEDLELLCKFVQTGKMRPLIDRRYPLSEAGTAIAYVEEGHARGKVIITQE
jgi:NADPH:quinone reductase-like Zn-dependent oxidoreductase